MQNQFGGPAAGGGQFGTSGNAEAGSAEYVVQQFYGKLMADDLSGMEDLFSRHAMGIAKQLRAGAAKSDAVAKLKAALANAKPEPSGKSLKGKHSVVWADQAAGQAAVNAVAGNGKGPKARPITKVQFIVVTEGDKLAIEEIAVRTVVPRPKPSPTRGRRR